VMFAKSEN